jgi:hypothetical protein
LLFANRRRVQHRQLNGIAGIERHLRQCRRGSLSVLLRFHFQAADRATDLLALKVCATIGGLAC